ncbi:MAG: hypothetical protein E7174_02020 [Firmicutes bacterium]|nr:hypothetical protein [Bacillota bacterium]
MKKKLWIIIVAIILLVLIGGYLGYKIYYANYYDLSHIHDFEKSKDNFVIKDETITIKTTKLPEEDYLVFKNMKIRNDFKNWEVFSSSDDMTIKPKEDFIWYKLSDVGAIAIGRGDTVMQINGTGEMLSSDERVNQSSVLTEFYEENNITNDIELFKFLDKTKNDKNSIFDSVKDMKKFYDIHSLVRTEYTRIDGITLINGDYDGYCVNHNFEPAYIVECNILKDDMRYTLTFNNSKYFTNEMIKDLLNTLVIE